MPIDNFEICDSNVNLGNENNVLNVLGGNVETFESLANFSGYDDAIDPYCIYLMDKPRKIMWNTFFYFSFDFSRAFALIKRALIFFALILCMLSYLQAWTPFAEKFDKLLRALTVSALNSRVLTCNGVADAPCASVSRRPYSLGAPAPNLVRSLTFALHSLLLLFFSLNNMLNLSIGRG